MKNMQTKKLGEVCTITNGGTPETGVKKYWEGDILWITPKDMGRLDNIYVFDTERKISEEGLKNSSAKIIPSNSIILSSRAPIGYLAINRKEITTNQGCKGIIPKKRELDVHYLYYFLRYSNELLQKLGSGTTFKELSSTKLAEVEIPVAPLSEQLRIIKILDEVFEKIALAKENTEKNLKNSRELFDTCLQNYFSNPGKEHQLIRLAEVCEISSKLVDPRKPEFINLLHIGGANIESSNGKLIFLKTAKDERLISSKFIFDETMVLYSKIRPYLMKVARPDFKGLCSADIYPLSPLPGKLSRDYLFNLLLSSNFTKYAIKGSGRAGMPKVNREHLFEYSFYLAPISEQHAIVAKLDTLSAETKKLEGIYKQRLAYLEELKKSVLKKAFAGEL